MSPTAAWLTAASDVSAKPIFVYQIPDIGSSGIQFSSDAGHYPLNFVGGSSQPHHAGIISALPSVDRAIQSLPAGRVVSALGSLSLIDDGSYDVYFGDHTNTLRGKIIKGWVTFAGLAVTDAVQYMTARITRVSVTGGDSMRFDLTDSFAEKIFGTVVAEGTYTSAKLGDVVKQRLIDAGAVYPDDFDTTAWTTWTAVGKPGDYTVTGTWSKGRSFDIIEALVRETLTWFCVRRDGKFFIEQFADLGVSPTADIDLTDTNAVVVYPSTETFQDVLRKETVAYGSASPKLVISKTVNVLTTDPWWDGAADGEDKDPLLDSSADATLLCTDRITLLSHEHLLSRIDTDFRPLGYDLGDVVKLDLLSKGLPGNKNYHRLVGMRENPDNGVTALTLWTDLGGPAIV